MRIAARTTPLGWGIARSIALSLGLATAAAAPSFSEAQQQFARGEYQPCLEACEPIVREGRRSLEWALLLARVQMTVGQYPEAALTVSNALQRAATSLPLHWQAYEVSLANGSPARARQALEAINELAAARFNAYRDPQNFVILGRAALAMGADPKLVLERFYDEARRADPNLRDAALAAGDLALEKQDFDLAARTFRQALKQNPDDADLHHGLARAFEPSARPQMLESIQRALELNPRHVPSMLLLAEHQIDAEDYSGADATLDKVLQVNPWQPEAWACRSVIHHLHGRKTEEAEARTKALRFAPANPRVDHQIGRKLSRKYRFAEGAQHQRLALGMEPGFLPARLQLAQDLLRLGEDEGWRLAKEVQQQDAYEVTAFNLVTLQDTLAKYTTLTNESLVVRMDAREAPVFGDRVLDLLGRAHDHLCTRYGATLSNRVSLEFFSDQKDFAVRTFGMPDNPGFLGVCFGPVITANSPTAQGRPVNWEAVLWHEFAHVVTLHLTRNKMPRWLSEGISVYEERQHNPAWGQIMNPRFREMILGDDFRPIAELSAAFLAPKTPLHLEFAYFESSLVVEFLVDRFGLAALRQILLDLGEDRPLNDALAAHTQPLPELEKNFAAYAKHCAESLGPDLDWRKTAGARNVGPADLQGQLERAVEPILDRLVGEPAGAAGTSGGRTNYWELRQRAQQALDDQRWADAAELLPTLVALLPNQRGSDSAYAGLALAHRKLGNPQQEQRVLEDWTRHDAESPEAPRRLIELALATTNWPALAQNANRLLAIQPMLPQPHWGLAHAAEATGNIEAAVAAWQRVLRLDPPDPVEAHYRLARLLHAQGNPSARRHLLQALEEAPRFQEALALLLAWKVDNVAP